MKAIILTCAQPSNQLQIGNYLGAIQRWVAYQETHRCFFGIVDLHAITVPQKPADLHHHTLSCLAQYLACGLDPEKSTIFLQSSVPGHTQLAWALACMTPIGQLQRMTQFKDKSAQQEHTGHVIGSGLLYYPILMAADILLYQANLVPVGEDQKQHLELTRDLAERFNSTYGPTLNIPEPAIHAPVARVMSLQEPTKKMSKSDPDPKGVIFLLDEPKVMRKKILSAVTDTGQDICVHPDKPGISNLINLLSAFTQQPTQAIEAQFAGKGYGDFKQALADAVIAHLEPIQKRYQELMQAPDYLLGVLSKGQAEAIAHTQKTLETVFQKIGFLSVHP